MHCAWPLYACHMGLSYDTVYITEFFPQEDWRTVSLAEIEVVPGEAHTLRIEKQDHAILFWLDGEIVDLDVEPSWAMIIS